MRTRWLMLSGQALFAFGSGPDPGLAASEVKFLHFEISNFNTRSNLIALAQ